MSSSESVKASLGEAAAGLEEWSHKFDDSAVSGLSALFEIVDADEKLVRKFLEMIAHAEVGEPRVWVASFKRLVETIRTRWPTVLEEPVELRCGLAQWITISAGLSPAAEVGPEFPNGLVRTNLTEAEIDNGLSQIFAQENWRADWASRGTEAFRYNRIYLRIEDWPGLTATIMEAVRMPNMDAAWASELLAVASDANPKDSDFEAFAASLAKDGVTFRHFDSALDSGDSSDVARFLFLCLFLEGEEVDISDERARNGLQRFEAVLTDPQSNELVPQVQALIVERRCTKAPFDLYERRPESKPFVLNYIREAAAKEMPSEVIPSILFFEQLPLFHEAIKQPQPFDDFIAKMCRDPSFLNEVNERVFDVRVCDAVAAEIGFKDPHFRSRCVEGIGAISRQTWANVLQPPPEDPNQRALGLLRKLRQEHIEISPTTELTAALKICATKIAEDAGASDLARGDWELLLGTLDKEEVEDVRRSILTGAVALGKSTQSRFFKAFGPDMMDHELYRSIPDLLPKLLTPIVLARKPGGMEWIQELIKADTTFLETGFRKSDVAEFRRALALRSKDKEERAHGQADQRNSSTVEGQNEKVKTHRREFWPVIYAYPLKMADR